MTATFTPYLDSRSRRVPTDPEAYIRVRVTGAPRCDGSLLVYLPNGTGFVVNSRHLLRLDRDEEPSGPTDDEKAW